MRTTDAMAEVLARPIPKVPALRGRSVTILFYEASTRTRVSFEVAAKNLSADVVNIAAGDVVRDEGRVARRHDPDGRGARRARCSSCVTARRARRTSPRSTSAGASSTAATAGTPTRPRRSWTCTRCGRHLRRPARAEGRDPRRRPPLAGGPLATSGRLPRPVRTSGCAARRRSCAASRRGRRAGRRACRAGPRPVHRHARRRRRASRRRRRHGPPHPARTDGRRPAALASRVRGPVRPDAGAAGAGEAGGAGHASRAR